MAHIEKLLFRGLRSFGPNDDDEARLKFATPLTIILGQNGCGKTTIIEALKYATSGDMPSNSASGQGFVHDPKLSNSTEVRAQVKLQMCDTKGETLYVARTMQTTQNAKKLTFKTLDQTITRKSPAGENISISGRCLDINKEMCAALGVSHTILNYVIFCHQEDSNWPLDEGKQVKTKFDLIFDTAKYIKCLDNIKINRTTLASDARELEKDLTFLDVRRQEAVDKRSKLRDEESRLNVIKDKVDDYQNKLVPIKQKLSELLVREEDISSLISEKRMKTATLEAVKCSIREYREGITTEFQGSTDELRLAISDFRAQSSQQESRLEAMEGEMSNLQADEKHVIKKVSTEQVLMGQLSRDQEQHKERIEQRNKLLTELCNQLETASNILTEGDVLRSFGSVERSIREAESALNSLRDSGDKEDKSLQVKIDNLREEKTKLEQTSRLKSEQIASYKQEARQTKLKIDEVNQSTEKLNRLTKQLEKVQKATDELANAVNLNNLDQHIKDLETQRDKLEDDHATLEKEVRELQSISQLTTEMNILQDGKRAKETEVRKLRNKTEDTLKHLLGHIPESGIKHELQSCVNKLAHTIQTMQSNISEQQRQLTLLEADHKHLKEKHREKTQALEKRNEELESLCESREYETVLAEVKRDLDQAQDEKGNLKASARMFRKYLDKLKRDQPCCPLCHRDFKDYLESQELITDLEGQLKSLPRQIEDKEIQLDKLQERHGQLLQLKPTFERIRDLKNNEIPSLQAQLNASETKLKTARQKIAVLGTDLTIPQADEHMAKQIQGDVALLDQQTNDLRKLVKDIDNLEQRMPKGGSGRNLESAINEQDSIRKKIQCLRKDLQSSLEKRNQHNQKLHQLQTEKNVIVGQQLKIQGEVQQKKQLEDKLEELQVQELFLSEEYDGIREALPQMTDNLEAAILEKEQARKAHKRALDQEGSKVNNLTRQSEEVKKLQEAITKYKQSGTDEKLMTTKQTINSLNAEKGSLMEKTQKLLEQMDQVKAQVTNQQVYERELNDNLKLRDKREEEKKISQEISELSIKIGGMNIHQVLQEKEDLKKREESLLKDMAHTEGRKRELQTAIESLRVELNKEVYKTVDKNYAEGLIKLKVTRAAVDDLGHYSKALDWAVSHFHKERMKHINDIIGDLWTQIYCGNDIDTIKIKIDEDIPTGDVKRKTYNYRVVQVKNGQELDMRGRCSAGQKMLASLIIRMALAEIFSTKCGILTLDEPTTNLDKENIDRLCSALANLINIRAAQKSNFQLIVITHDEEFIDKLTNMYKVDFYYSVCRNQMGKSVVNSVDVS